MVNVLEELRILLSFTRIGIPHFRGSDYFLPTMQRELCEKNKWMTRSEVERIYFGLQNHLGSLSLNSAYISGMEIAGRLGSMFAVVGLVLPSIVSIALLEIPMRMLPVQGFWKLFLLGVRAILVGMTFFGVFQLSLADIKSHVDIVILLGAFISSIEFLEISALWTVLTGAAALLSVFIYSQNPRKGTWLIGIYLIAFAIGGLKPLFIFSVLVTLSLVVYVLENSEGSRL